MNILNGTKAFEAMSAGQKIECRHVGSDLDFDEIRNFPATVFIDQEYEFRVAVVYMLIGAIRVPEATKEAPAKGTLCFTPSLLTTELSKSFKWKNSDLDLALLQRGQVHLYEENAVIHAQALITISHGSFKADEASTADNELPWEDKNVQNPTSNDVEDKSFERQSSIQIIKQGPVTAVEDSLSEGIETDPVKIIEKFTAQINACTSNDTVLALRHVFMANGHLDREHTQHLCKLTEDKLLELDPEQYTPKLESPSENLSIEELQRLQAEAEKLVTENRLAEQAESEYQALLKELLEGVANASTPAEVNSHTRYTKPWTELQRKPLLNAIHKRLQELAPAEAEIKMPPSLMVQIQNAPDLTTLDALEIDVSTRHADIQPKLMGYVKQRRFELENQASEAS
ncbi:hypothetical protein D7V64_16685 [Acinetobacter cumulans]|uniref:Uncharacterized protein n=1 Tax=Acinetobacter cumulans TaxID=2136182 RepID=A0A3A8G1S1_9GAMM|nr:hypothetical protein [Acinetobacter cumulans]RKG47491.1 hypothetical protein D7V64_16685 [Acinetobacter cumulans]